MITSPHNPRLKLVRKLQSRRQREALGLFVCEGEDLVDAAIRAGAEPVDLLIAGDTVDPRLVAALSTLPHPSRVIGVFRRADVPALEPAAAPPTGLALWRVADPGNVGTILRAADALGPAFVALSAGCADPFGTKALRASAGAVFRVALGRFDAAPGARVALVPRGGAPLADVELPDRTTFVLGAEREGLPEGLVAGADVCATIPVAPGAESLNVAVAAAIALYERRRRPTARDPAAEADRP